MFNYCSKFKIKTFLAFVFVIFNQIAFAQSGQTSGALPLVKDKKNDRPTLVVGKNGNGVYTELKSNTEKTGSIFQFQDELEKKVFSILNKTRVENGLSELTWNAELAQVARIHSGNMAKFSFFSHKGLDGFSVNDRADSIGFINWTALGENIAFNRGYEQPVEKACESWMNSKGHRENILNKRWKESAVGVAVTADGTYYFTQVFVLK